MLDCYRFKEKQTVNYPAWFSTPVIAKLVFELCSKICKRIRHRK